MITVVMLFSAVLGVGVEPVWQREMRACPGFQAVLSVSPASVKSGNLLRFSLVLKNVSSNPVRMLEIRGGHRPDLAQNYFQLMLERSRTPVTDLPFTMSDPGPVTETDFFALPPGNSVEVPVPTKLQLGPLEPGSYSAYVRINPDPYSTAFCRSTRASFSVKR